MHKVEKVLFPIIILLWVLRIEGIPGMLVLLYCILLGLCFIYLFSFKQILDKKNLLDVFKEKFDFKFLLIGILQSTFIIGFAYSLFFWDNYLIVSIVGIVSSIILFIISRFNIFPSSEIGSKKFVFRVILFPILAILGLNIGKYYPMRKTFSDCPNCVLAIDSLEMYPDSCYFKLGFEFEKLDCIMNESRFVTKEEYIEEKMFECENDL